MCLLYDNHKAKTTSKYVLMSTIVRTKRLFFKVPTMYGKSKQKALVEQSVEEKQVHRLFSLKSEYVAVHLPKILWFCAHIIAN